MKRRLQATGGIQDKSPQKELSFSRIHFRKTTALFIILFTKIVRFFAILDIPASVSGRFQSCHGTGHRSL